MVNQMAVISDGISDYNFVVDFDEEYLGFFITAQNQLKERRPLYDSLPLEVIGNLHQNPELLT